MSQLAKANSRIAIRRVGNSLGILIPKNLIGLWGVGEGDFLEAGDGGITPPKKKNQQLILDDLKLAISMEVVSRFSVNEIRKKSRENLARWKKSGTWGTAYQEWRGIMANPDSEQLIKIMIGRDDNSNRLRQSMPYAGLLPRTVVESLREKITG